MAHVIFQFEGDDRLNRRAAVHLSVERLFLATARDDKPQFSTLQIGLQSFMSTEANQWGPMMAATTMASLPIL